MGKPLTFQEARILEMSLYSPGLDKMGGLYVLSHLAVKDMTTTEIKGIFPPYITERRKGYVSRIMFYLMLEGLVDGEPVSKEEMKWSINDHGRNIEKLLRETAGVMQEAAAYRMKNLPDLKSWPSPK